MLSPCWPLDHPAAAVAVFSGYATPTMAQHRMRLGADAAFRKEHPEELSPG